MKKYGPVLLLSLLASSCLVRKNTSYSDQPRVHVDGGEIALETATLEVPEAEEAVERVPSTADAVVETAMEYTGVRYKYGGLTRKGMDCSGLMYVSFLENDIPLPRTSDMMAETGKRIEVSQVQKGDLLFFDTRRGRKKINHAGLVVDVEGDDVRFIHSTTSRGVIVSSLREGFWNYSFVKAARIL